MKKFILGLLIGIITSFSVTAFAAVQFNIIENPFPVLINGVETEVEGYNINGSTYLKLADFRKTGLGIEFNDKDRRIEVVIDVTSGGGMVTTEQVQALSEFEDYMINTIDGKQYIGPAYIQNVLRPKGYDLVKILVPVYDPKTSRLIDAVDDNKWKLIKGVYDSSRSREDQSENYEILIEDVPLSEATFKFGYKSVEADYYINTILPLIQ